MPYRGVKLAKNADLDKCIYSGHDIRFNSCSELSLSDCRVGKNIIIFGVDMSKSAYIDNKNKDILILVKSLTQELDDATLTAEA